MRTCKCLVLFFYSTRTTVMKEVEINNALLLGECGRLYVCVREVYEKTLSLYFMNVRTYPLFVISFDFVI